MPFYNLKLSYAQICATDFTQFHKGDLNNCLVTWSIDVFLTLLQMS